MKERTDLCVLQQGLNGVNKKVTKSERSISGSFSYLVEIASASNFYVPIWSTPYQKSSISIMIQISIIKS